MDPHRSERLIEALRQELNELITYEMSDPRVDNVTVTEVILSPDGRRAQVRLGIAGGEQRQREAVAALEHAKNYIRTVLLQRLQMFRLPDLRFEADVHAELGGKLDFLMRRIRKGRPRDAEPQAAEKKPAR